MSSDGKREKGRGRRDENREKGGGYSEGRCRRRWSAFSGRYAVGAYPLSAVLVLELVS